MNTKHFTGRDCSTTLNVTGPRMLSGRICYSTRKTPPFLIGKLQGTVLS